MIEYYNPGLQGSQQAEINNGIIVSDLQKFKMLAPPAPGYRRIIDRTWYTLEPGDAENNMITINFEYHDEPFTLTLTPPEQL